MAAKPDFIGIGGQRCGTAWLYNCLDEHPALCLPEKEINYFVHEEKFSQGAAWYDAQFDRCAPDKLTGEMSSLYLYHPDAPKRIHDHNPDARLIVSLRNPVDRTYSSYLNLMSAGEIPRETSFETAIDSYPDIVEKSRYADGVERFLELFGPEQLLVLIYDEGLDDPLAFVRGIYRFLGVDDGFESAMASVQLNVGRVSRSVAFDRALDRVGDVMRAARLTGLLRWMKRTGAVGGIRSLNGSGGPPDFAYALRERLTEGFAADVDRLSRLLGRPLDVWGIR